MRLPCLKGEGGRPKAAALLSNGAGDNIVQWPQIACAKAFARRIVPGLRIDPFHVDLMACLSPQHEKKGTLRAAVALAEGVNGIQFGHVAGRARSEFRGAETA